MDNINKEVFKERLTVCPSFFQILLGKKPKINAIIEINNLLANKFIQNIDLEEIENIAAEYKINLKKEFEQQLYDLYRSYLDKCLEDKFLSGSEIADLKHLKNILLLNDQDINKLNQEATSKIYKTEVAYVVNDGNLDSDEKDNLYRLRSELRLSDEDASKIYEEGANEIINKFIDQAISDERLSPREEEELEKIINSLKVSPKLDERTRSVLDKYRLYWQIENGIYPYFEDDTFIDNNEKCFYKADVHWLAKEDNANDCQKHRQLMKLKISKNEHFSDDGSTIELTATDAKNIKDAVVYLTEKKLIMVVNGVKTVYALKEFCSFRHNKNMIEIKFQSKKLIIIFSDSADVFCLLLGKAWDIKNLA